jgi:hypothetical protein
MIGVTKDETIKRLREAAKEQIRKAKDEERVQSLTNAIGDRRKRDVLDILAVCEQEDSWQVSVEYLIRASDSKYTRPIGIGSSEPMIEPLKYRETVFHLFSCTGLEPIRESTTTLLKEVEDESSIANATRVFTDHVVTSSTEQIRDGDTLFFNLSNLSNPSAENLRAETEKIRRKEIKEIRLGQDNGKIIVDSLWYSEYGREALTELGIKGNSVDNSQLELVLSVIQLPNDLKAVLRKAHATRSESLSPTGPSNHHYKKLLESTISQDISQLRLLGSRLSLPTMTNLILKAADEFLLSESSDDYRNLLFHLDSLVAIRALDSIMTLENMLKLRNLRINTPAATALGNFYHESASATLIDMICTNTDRKILQACEDALLNIQMRNPETVGLIAKYLERSNCRNISHLKRIYKHSAGKISDYYEQ